MKEFFDKVRHLFDGALTQEQVDGLNQLVDEGILREVPKAQLAYILATTFHETARTMLPIKEYGGPAYFHRMYDIEGARPHVARALGNLEPGDGVKFAGRSYVQTTGRYNYERMGARIGVNLIDNPDRALEVPVALKLLFVGMLEGLYTGKKLGQYINETKTDYRNARRVVNGMDRANLIAGYAKAFRKALDHVDFARPEVDPAPAQSWLGALLALLARLFGGDRAYTPGTGARE